MGVAVRDYLRWIQDTLALTRDLAGAPRRSRVLVFAFHAVFENKGDRDAGVCDPQQGITVKVLREFVDALTATRVPIVALDQAIDAACPGLRCAITFDDGYFNNLLALPILREYHVPATFYIATDYIEQQKTFWWDALYRECSTRGWSQASRVEETRRLKLLQNAHIEEQLVARFGGGVFRPVGDVDRPFRPAELAEFAAQPGVALGNHTKSHAILPRYSAEEVLREVSGAQEYLTHLTGMAPRSLAYPNGDWSVDASKAAARSGLSTGLTLERGVNIMGGTDVFRLRRNLVWSTPGPGAQVRAIRWLGP